MEAMQRIVVGVDGSQYARRALAWAVDEARLRRARLEVVHVWHAPYMTGFPFATMPVSPVELEEAAHHLLTEIVSEIDAHDLAAPVEKVMAVGSPAECLLKVAQGADLLVVGSRGLGGFAGLLLGSVSHQVAHHATCPVVIIPPND